MLVNGTFPSTHMSSCGYHHKLSGKCMFHLHVSCTTTFLCNDFQVDVNQFKAVLESFKPNMAECLCDTIPASGQTEKRIRKSVDRTLKFLDQCIEEREKTKVGELSVFSFYVAFSLNPVPSFKL